MCMCVSMSVCRKSEFCWNGWIDRAGFIIAWRLPSSYPIQHCKEIRVPTSNNQGTSLWDLVANSGHRHLATARQSQRVVNLVRQRWTLSVINWTVAGQRSWQYFLRSTASLLHWSSVDVTCTSCHTPPFTKWHTNKIPWIGLRLSPQYWLPWQRPLQERKLVLDRSSTATVLSTVKTCRRSVR